MHFMPQMSEERRETVANPKMSEEYRNVRGVRINPPPTNKRDGSVPHAPRTHVPLHSRSADTHLIPKMSEEHCNEGTNPKMSEEFRKVRGEFRGPHSIPECNFFPLTGTVRGKKVEGGPRGSAEVPQYFQIYVFLELKYIAVPTVISNGCSTL